MLQENIRIKEKFERMTALSRVMLIHKSYRRFYNNIFKWLIPDKRTFKKQMGKLGVMFRSKLKTLGEEKKELEAKGCLNFASCCLKDGQRT